MTRKSLGLKFTRGARWTVAMGSAVVLLAGCQFGGLNSLAMPGTAGHGPGSYSVFVDLQDAATLPQNSPVMVDDVTVGSVSGVAVVEHPAGQFFARLKLSLDGDVKLPRNTTAKLAQTSLLGSMHVDLLKPPQGQPSQGELRNNDTIELSRTSSYPTTEEVLSALGVVVSKGNLGALQDITNEAYAAFVGRQGSFADLIPRLADFTASLNQQTNDIIATAEGLNRFADILARHKDSLSRTLDTLPAALKVLNDNRANIVDAFAALGKLARVAAHILSESKADFAKDVMDLYALIKPLNDNRSDLVSDLDGLATYPFTGKNLKRVARGDYFNVYATFDLTIRRLGESIFTTASFDPNMQHLSEVINPPDWLAGETANLSGQAADPFKIPPGTASGEEVPPN